MSDYRMNPPIIVPEITETGTYSYIQSSTQCCPVCKGTGTVPLGFYNRQGYCWSSSGAGPETCRSCDGKGYVIVK